MYGDTIDANIFSKWPYINLKVTQILKSYMYML